ncbi:MAG: hypothetical protein A2Y25_01295 [Candidatus Melainabacteria bacterium GWF2_37_15]|nr:MAG: hypothetical protein A2Y25_01295 [Candidatus Melainabacteria bacterium GWF2_37_15]
MKKSLVSLTAAMLIVSAGNYAYAQEPPFMHHENGQKMTMEQKKQHMQQVKDELQQRLNLTETQQEKSKQMHMEHREVMKPLMDKIHQKWQEIKALKESGASQEEIKVKKEEIKALREQTNTIRKEHMQKFESILTPEQKTEFKKFREEMKLKKKNHKKQ